MSYDKNFEIITVTINIELYRKIAYLRIYINHNKNSTLSKVEFES